MDSAGTNFWALSFESRASEYLVVGQRPARFDYGKAKSWNSYS